MHGFWRAAEAGLDDWAARCPADAEGVDWSRRRRASLFATDLRDARARPRRRRAALPAVAGTDEALGRMYVLEGSTLGGVFIDRHLAALPELAGVACGAFSPYGSETGAMWPRSAGPPARGSPPAGTPARCSPSARTTFAELADWCRRAAVPGVPA